MSPFSLVLLLGISFLWSVQYLLIGGAEAAFRPIMSSAIILISAAVSVAVLVGLLMRRPLLPTLRAHLSIIVFLSVTAIVVPTVAAVMAQKRIEPDLAALVGTTVPIATFLMTGNTAGRRERLLLRLGAVISVVGVVVFIGIGDLIGALENLEWAMVMSSGGIVFAYGGIVAERRTAQIDPFVLTVWIMAIGAAIVVVLALGLAGLPDLASNGPSVLRLGVAGAASLGLGYVGYYALIRRAGAYTASLFAYIVPVCTFAIAVGLGIDDITPSHIAGIVLVLMGLITTARASAAKRAPPPSKVQPSKTT